MSQLAVAGSFVSFGAQKVKLNRRTQLRALAYRYLPKKPKSRRGVKSRAGW